MTTTTILWLVLFVLAVAAEAATVSVVSIWFAVGALAAMITSIAGGQLWLQAVVFVVISACLLLALRPVIKKYFTPKLVKTNVDAMIGKTGIVTVRIDNIAATGTVKIGAMEWSARSTDGSCVEAGTQVCVDRIEGVKVFVTPQEVPVQVI